MGTKTIITVPMEQRNVVAARLHLSSLYVVHFVLFFFVLCYFWCSLYFWSFFTLHLVNFLPDAAFGSSCVNKPEPMTTNLITTTKTNHDLAAIFHCLGFV